MAERAPVTMHAADPRPMIGGMHRLVSRLRQRSRPLRGFTAATLLVTLADHEGPRWLHALTGIAFAAALSGHLLANSRWISTVARRLRRGLARPVAIDALVDTIMMFSVVTVAGSGFVALLAPAEPGRDGSYAGDLHGSAVAVLAVAVAVHVVRHRRQLSHRTGRRAGASAGRRAVGDPGLRNTRTAVGVENGTRRQG